MKITEALNTLPRLTYRWLRLNHREIPGGLEFPLKPYKKAFLPKAIDSDLILQETRGETQIDYLAEKGSFGVAEKLVSFGERFSNAGFYLEIPKGKKAAKPLHIMYELAGDDDAVNDHNVIVAGENSSVTVIIEYGQKGVKPAYHNGVTKVFAGEGAEVTLIKVQRLSAEAYHLDSVLLAADDTAKVKAIQVELGGKYSITNYQSRLAKGSDAAIDAIYFGDGGRVLDLSYHMIHKGFRSKSNIAVRGALRQQARKVFRGTLDFRRGSHLADGNEEEYVILLDPTVKSDAIPLLLAEEDDVQGEHAASAGKVDPNQLFYLMSRGFSEAEAVRAIVQASFDPLLAGVCADVRLKIQEEVGRRLLNVKT
ncbi:MAG TPA: Fe-S cluster assembly protein SufD [Firmicutes bacterium]|nr:Fe-S cluster assembly protein SufD [Bacillota bacterium]